MALRGEEGWHTAQKQLHTPERWEELHQSLQREVEHLCFLNPFLLPHAQQEIKDTYQLQPTTIPGAYTFEIPIEEGEQYSAVDSGDEGVIFVSPHTGMAMRSMQMAPFLFMDAASIIAAKALHVEEEDRVLDVCAGPGGKALVLASMMFAKRLHRDLDVTSIHGRLVCNDFSKARATRMQEAVMAFLPPALFLESSSGMAPRVVFTSVDARTPSNTMEKQGPFDKILVDAPCTSDRMLARGGDKGRLVSWSPAVHSVAADSQVKLLYKQLWLLEEGGILLYCSSSMSPVETDDVIAKLLIKAKGSFELEVLPLDSEVCDWVSSPAVESSDWGVRIMPDKTPCGPLYMSRIRCLRRFHAGM